MPPGKARHDARRRATLACNESESTSLTRDERWICRVCRIEDTPFLGELREDEPFLFAHVASRNQGSPLTRLASQCGLRPLMPHGGPPPLRYSVSLAARKGKKCQSQPSLCTEGSAGLFLKPWHPRLAKFYLAQWQKSRRIFLPFLQSVLYLSRRSSQRCRPYHEIRDRRRGLRGCGAAGPPHDLSSHHLLKERKRART